MVRKLFIFALLLLLIPSLAFAGEEKVIHNEWHSYNDFFTIGSDYYEITNTHYVSSDKILIKTLLNHNQAGSILSATAELNDEDEFVVSQESCQRSGVFRYCILNVSLQPKEGARADESGQYHYGTRIKIYEEIPDEALLTVTHELDDSTLHVGEKTRLLVRVYNKGTKLANNIYFNETIGSGLRITDYNGFTSQVGNQLSLFTPFLRPEESFVARVWVEVFDVKELMTLTSSLAYEAPHPKTVSAKSTISVPKPYVFSYKAPASSVKISVPTTLSYTITNKDIVPANVSVFFRLPHDMFVKSSVGFSSLTDSSYSAVLEPDEEITLSKTLQSDFTGESDYAVDVSFKVRDEEYTDSREGIIKITSGKVTPTITTGTPVALAGKQFTYGLYAHNDDKEQSFYSVTGWVGTDFFNDTFELASIKPGEDKKLSFMTYTLPQVDQATTYMLKAYGTFLTHSGEENFFETQKEIVILPKNQTLVLLQKTDKTSLKRGEVVTITITAENLASSGQEEISAQTTYDSLLEKTFGDKISRVYLYGGEKQELYVLKLKVPFDYYKDSFDIFTELKDNGVVHSTQLATIKVTDPVDPPVDYVEPVDPVDPNLEKTNTTTNATENGDPVNPKPGVNKTNPVYPDKKPNEEGFIARILNAFGDFFANLFS